MSTDIKHPPFTTRAGSKCVEDWEILAVLCLLHQLGVIPQLAQAGV